MFYVYALIGSGKPFISSVFVWWCILSLSPTYTTLFLYRSFARWAFVVAYVPTTISNYFIICHRSFILWTNDLRFLMRFFVIHFSLFSIFVLSLYVAFDSWWRFFFVSHFPGIFVSLSFIPVCCFISSTCDGSGRVVFCRFICAWFGNTPHIVLLAVECVDTWPGWK